MAEEITVGIQSGNVTFSFKTDREGRNLKEGFETINKLISTHKELLSKAISTFTSAPSIEHRTEVSISQLNIPPDEKEAILRLIDRVPRFDLLILLLHYADRRLDFEQIILLSRELGKPIKYNWLDSEPHRLKRRGFIMSERMPGKKEKLYSLTERGKKKAESITNELKKMEHLQSPATT